MLGFNLRSAWLHVQHREIKIYRDRLIDIEREGEEGKTPHTHTHTHIWSVLPISPSISFSLVALHPMSLENCDPTLAVMQDAAG